jgi:hypothetical protein
MNRYEKHLNERLQQQSAWQQVGAMFAQYVMGAIWVAILIVFNLAFIALVIWLVTKLAGG